jgi:hypothetical protein
VERQIRNLMEFRISHSNGAPNSKFGGASNSKFWRLCSSKFWWNVKLGISTIQSQSQNCARTRVTQKLTHLKTPANSKNAIKCSAIDLCGMITMRGVPKERMKYRSVPGEQIYYRSVGNTYLSSEWHAPYFFRNHGSLLDTRKPKTMQ